ncbi:MAG: hypothetical protein ABI718_01990 [Acidobacteriota bacterium]
MTLLLTILLTTLSVRQHPASPSVGDPITLEYQLAPGQRLTLRPSPDFEIVSSGDRSFVVRAFQTGKFIPEGMVSGPSEKRERVRGPLVTIRSVLAKDDQLKPAPLHPPVPLPRNRAADVALAAAAIAAMAAWACVALLSRRRGSGSVQASRLSPDEEFFETLQALRDAADNPQLLIAVADASRRYLSRVEERWGRELTTFELLGQAGGALPEHTLRSLRHILTAADLEKFSPWGSRVSGFRQFVEEARGILIPKKEEPAA